jgi:hypothetical protein
MVSQSHLITQLEWQSLQVHGRDPTDQQRSWLVNKIRTGMTMMGIKLNAQVMIKNLEPRPLELASRCQLHFLSGSHGQRAKLPGQPSILLGRKANFSQVWLGS